MAERIFFGPLVVVRANEQRGRTKPHDEDYAIIERKARRGLTKILLTDMHALMGQKTDQNRQNP